ncbi:MAG: HEAT repeat domain-containing protein [Planctomycetes bacterium]|nr:HEAT repeat domain-containing protein [Planctomycetota bacterium]
MKRIQFSLASLMSIVLVVAIALATFRSYRPSYFNPVNVVLLLAAAVALLIRGTEHRPFWLGFLLSGCVYQVLWYRSVFLQEIAFLHTRLFLERILGANSFPSSALRTLLASMLCDSLTALLAALAGGFSVRLIKRWSRQILQARWLRMVIRGRDGVWGWTLGVLAVLSVAVLLLTGPLLWTTWRDFRTRRALTQADLPMDQRYSAMEALAGKGSAAVSELCQILEEGDPVARKLAATALGRIGQEAKDAVPVLIRAIDDEDPRVRAAAVWALLRIGDRLEAAIPGLVRRLADENSSTRWEAAKALAKAGPSAIPPVVAAIANENAEKRKLVLEILGAIGMRDKAAVATIRNALKDDAEPVRAEAWHILLSTGTGDFDFDDVLSILHDRKYRVQALWLLPRCSPDAESAIPHLIRALEDDDWSVRHAATGALAEIGPQARAAVPLLVRALKDQSRDVRRNAATALGKMASEAASAVPALIECLKQDAACDPEVSQAAARALRENDANQARALVPHFLELLGSEDDVTRWSATDALRGLGPEAEPAVPALVVALADSNTTVRFYAALALAEIGPGAAEAVPKIIEKLKTLRSQPTQLTGEPDLEPVLIQALGVIGPKAEAAVPLLLELLTQGLSQVFTVDYGPVNRAAAAATALGRIGRPRETIVPVLVKATEHKRPEIAWSAVWALAEVGCEARVAVPLLLRALDYPNAYVRARAAMALGKLQADPHTVVPALCRALNDRNHYVRTAAAMALGQFGPQAKAAVDALVTAVQDADNAVRNEYVLRTFQTWLWHDPNPRPDPDTAGYFAEFVEELRYRSVRDVALEALRNIDPLVAASLKLE